MGFHEWVSRSFRRIGDRGWLGVKDSVNELYGGIWRYLGWHVPRGTNVYEHDWDTLVILDACRVDLMEDLADEFPFIDGVESYESVGSMSEEWMKKTFRDAYRDEMERTAYVTANVFSETVLSDDMFLELDEVWRYAWDEDLGIVPPGPVTDRAIAVSRELHPDRLIVHYMQPHHPFIADKPAVDGPYGPDPFGRYGDQTIVDALRHDEISSEEFWSAYRSNLKTVLDDVSVLLANHDSETVILTADHGDAFGEWGIYDHPAGCLHPAVKNVPWVETAATDTGEYEPTTEPQADDDVDVDERLKNLGYQ